jgi:glycosyltransferase involved in cell wall biosynthesis
VIVPARDAEIVWVYRRGRRRLLDEWQRGDAGSEFFYGLVPLSRRFGVGFVEDESAHPFRRAWYPVECLIARRLEMGFALDVAVKHLWTLNRAQVVVSTVDACGLPLAMLKRVGLLRSRLVYVSQGLSDRVRVYGVDRALARWCGRLVRAADALATLSAGAQVGLARWLGLPLDRVHVLPFGTDHEFWRSTEADATAPQTTTPRIVSVGSDPGRDYATLLAAAHDLPLHVVTRLPVEERPNVLHTATHTARELRDIYSHARCVVMPLHDRDQPSGQSAALQAMACGKAVVLTRTRGWWGEDLLRDRDNCLVVPPGDVDALEKALRELWNSPALCASLGEAARETVVRHFSEVRFADALAAIMAPYLAAGRRPGERTA